MTPSGPFEDPSPADYQAFVEQANDGMLAVDPELRVQFVNQAFLELLGYTPEEVLGRPITEFMDMNAAQKVEAERDRRKLGARSHYEVEVRTKGGDARMLHVAAVPKLGADGAYHGTFAIVTDLTDKIAMEARVQEYAHNLETMVQARTDALIASEERYQDMFERVSDGIFRVDRRGTILLCNQAMAEMVGTTRGALMGGNMMTLVHEDDRALVYDVAQKHLNGEPTPRHQVYRMRRLDTEDVVYVETSATLTHKEGEIENVQVIARDVTERVLAEEAMRQAYTELKALSQAKSNFLSNITHELKTPLVTIRGYAQMLHGENLGPLTEEQRQALGTSLKNTDVLLAQIERLLSVTRLELDREHMRFEAIHARDLLHGCCDDTRPLAMEKQIRLQVAELPADLPPLRGDWVTLHEALEHLIVNGIKFTDAGGCVEVGAAQPDGDTVRLYVRDTGIGMEPERTEKLFEPFEQADGSHTRDYEGLGLGLSLVRRIIEAHTGSLGVESTVGVGSTFWCDVPASADTPTPRPDRPARTFATLWDVSADHRPDAPEDEEDFDLDTFDLDEGFDQPVVFVDHDVAMLELLATAFRDAEYPVDTITVPEDVLPRLRATGARVVFVDVGFPHADGVEICRQLKQDPDTRGIPVYVFTGHNGADVQARALAAGADGFIAKPASLEYLLGLAEHYT